MHKKARQFTHIGRWTQSGHQSKRPGGWNTNCTVVGSVNWKNQIRALNLRADAGRVRAPICPTRQRLTQAFSRLQNIQLARSHRQDSLFKKWAEERIIWRELLELELQDVDEQIERISAAAGERLGLGGA